jgi:hypothetical protein
MRRFVEGTDRGQSTLFPECLEDWIEENNPVLPYPYGREITRYEVSNLSQTLSKATAADATVLVEPYFAAQRRAAMVEFPVGYIAEIHSSGGN